MKSFKSALYLILLFLISGCGNYVHLFQTESNDLNEEKGSFVYETNAIKITYSFWEEKGLMAFTIYNKLDQPMFVDWKQSAYIKNFNKLNYWDDEELFSSISYSIESNISSGKNVGSLIKPERITFIPPKSRYDKFGYYLLPDYKIDINSKIEKGNKASIISIIKYSKDNSPLIFRNYLAFSLTENFDETIYIDNKFYLSNIQQMDYKTFQGNPKLNDKGRSILNKDGTYEYMYPHKNATMFYHIIPYEQRVIGKN